MLDKNTILENYNQVLENVESACQRSNRENDVKIVAVTKTFPHELIKMCIEMGIDIVGENRPQEIKSKYAVYNDQVKWHMIGHLQRNKVKYIIDKVDLIHSLDSVRLAKEINKRAKKENRIMECLIQVNIVNEASKFGIDKDDVMSFISEVSKYEHIKIVGLMNMAPFYDDSEQARSDFRQMKILFDELKNIENDNIEMKYLSMGMTNDYQVAVEEGSNMIRVGSGIFGQRDYN